MQWKGSLFCVDHALFAMAPALLEPVRMLN